LPDNTRESALTEADGERLIGCIELQSVELARLPMSPFCGSSGFL